MTSFIDKIGLTAKITRPRTEAFLKRHATDKLVLDIGAGNDSYREFFPNKKTLELNPRGPVDYVGNIEDMHMIPDGTFDAVLLIGVLEHVENPFQGVKEVYRILKPGGVVLLELPFIYPIHDYPGDYWRFTDNGIRLLLKDFKIEELEGQTNTMETFALLFQRIGFQCDTLGWRPFKAGWFLLSKLFLRLQWLLKAQYGDIGHTVKVENIMLSGYHIAARKG